MLISPPEDSGFITLANFERGVYEPSDEVKVYDGSEEEEDVEGSRLPLLIVLALLVLAMFGGVVWLAYTQGVARGRGETPVLAAAGGPERVAPQDPSGGNVPYQGFKIYEQPAPPDDSAEAAAPAAPAPAAPQAQPAPPAKAAAPASEVKTPPPAKTVAALIQQANSEPAKPVAKPPAAKPAAPPPAPAASATGAPRQLGAPVAAAAKPAAPAAAAKPAAPVATAAKPATPAAAGGFVLQIGAYKSQADAATAWKTYQSKHAALLAGYSDNVQQVDLGEKGTWYRLRVGGFADREVATALCDRLKADGGACILGR